MKRVQKKTDTPDNVWREISMEDLVFVCYGPMGDSRAVMIDRDDKAKVKTLYVFQSKDAAVHYVKEMGSNFFSGEVKLGFLIEKLRSVYEEEKDHQVKCVLTGLEQDGILYELDVLWQLFTH